MLRNEWKHDAKTQYYLLFFLTQSLSNRYGVLFELLVNPCLIKYVIYLNHTPELRSYSHKSHYDQR